MWSLSAAQRAIVVGGALAMAYTQLTMSPATIAFARSLGATGWHIGLLGALPAGMLFMQFVAALLVNHLRYRRWLWLGVSVVQRLVLVPIAVGPWLVPGLSDTAWIWWLIGLTAVNHALIHFSSPLWLSWMGDYLPHAGLNRFWGVRHQWMEWAAAASLLGAALFMYHGGYEIRPAFAVLVGVGAVFGLADVLLFVKVYEPAVSAVPEPRLRSVLAAPFRDPDFRSFISFTCFWHVAAMVAAPFISYYLLVYVHMDVYHLLLLWTFSWVGGAFFSGRLGQLAERFGNRPVLVLATAFKSTNVIALLLVPRDPVIAFWILIPVFMVDALLNAAIAIANNGFMIKNSPAENRTMFIAAGTAVAGMVGGATSVVAGAALWATSDWSMTWGGTVVSNFHIIFAISLVLRLAAAVLARRVREPTAHDTAQIVVQLFGVTPLRILRFPVGLYRSLWEGSTEVDARRRKKRRKRRVVPAKL